MLEPPEESPMNDRRMSMIVRVTIKEGGESIFIPSIFPGCQFDVKVPQLPAQTTPTFFYKND